ncbi:hypothetical protein [Massilia sp. METH4]|uniref:hypothetical protein n=1 Tax=Massilia sp. METH4 TaxID=3123041 RepID=UPI0030D1C6D7
MSPANPADVQQRVHGAEHRLKELIGDMHDIWHSSVAEGATDGRLNLYAVDSDVVYMFMAPDKLHHYGALLRYDGEARHLEDRELQLLESKLVEFLGNLIFFQLQPDCAPLLIGDHAIELQKILTDAGEEAMRKLRDWETITLQLKRSASEVTLVSRERLHDAAQIVEHGTAAAPAAAADINALLNDIHASLRGDGAIGKLFRFDLLAAADRVKHLDRLALQNGDGSPSALPSPVTADGKYIAPVSRLAARLLQRMTQLDTIHTPARKLTMQGDAVVLAHLAWLNEQLDRDAYYLETAQGPRRVGRLLLITGSQLLPRAIKDLGLADLDRVVFSPLSLLGHRLMDEYVQSSGTDSALAPPGASGVSASSLINFLDAMRLSLAQAIREGDYNKIGETLGRVRGEHARLIDSWQGRQLFGEHSRADGVSAAIAELQQQGLGLEALEGFMQRLSVKAWQAFARSVTLLGFKKADQAGVVQRNLPPLLLDGYPKARRLAQDLYRFVHRSAFGQVEESPMGAGTILAVTNEDPSHYTEFLCYALWALAHRLLRSAQGCAELALSIAEQEAPGPARSAKRLEALYLRAHVMKLRALTAEELQGARQGLDEWRQEAQSLAGGETAAAVPPATAVRLEGELFSVASHVCFVAAFGSSGKVAPAPHVRTRQQCRVAFLRGKALMASLNAAPDRAELWPYLHEFVRQQVLVNVVQLALLCKFGVTLKDDGAIDVFVTLEEDPSIAALEGDFAAAAEELSGQYRYLDGDESGDLPRPSVLIACVADAANAVWATQRSEPIGAEAGTGHLGSFDDRRFRFLEAVCRYRAR